ncbi:LacI family DNA-binding transcriptional regulator, partial [Phytoactinopolyspora endophytica]|uniref:LacI family DNA-binding transcriptional regulator n=1 Tax=Phytoactinopolyspora endophytica TaxID=1642495 RepID=UPI00197B19B2
MREASKALADRASGTAGQRSGTPTLRDVAREAGVSPATASRALNGSTRNVREENVAQVLAAAAKLNYEPHLSAQAFARGTTATAALVVRGIDDPYFSSIAAGAVQRAEEDDFIVTMAVADRSAESELNIVRTLRGQRPRAIILAGSRIEGADVREALVDELAAYRTAGGSVAIVSQHDLPFATVSVDNEGGAGQLARDLTAIGYRRFAVLHAGSALWTSRERHEGFLAG